MSEMARLLHDPAFYRLGLTLLHFLWQGAALALFAWAARLLLRRARPGIRYAVFLGLLTLMAAAPVVTFARCAEPPAPALMTQPEMDRLLAEAARQRGERVAPPGAEASTGAPPAAPAATPRPVRDPRLLAAGTWLRRAWRQLRMRLPMAGVLWVLGVALLSGRLLVQWALFARVVRWATPLAEEHWKQLLASLSARLGVRRAVRLLQSVEARTPVTAGWLRPVILLPPAVLLGLLPQQLEAVIAHELAHIRRHDFAINVWQRIVEVVLFYHPAVWWVSSLVRTERELCCDDLVVATCGSATTYARALTELEALRVRPPEPTLTVARGPVMARARRLVLAVEADRRPTTWTVLIFPVLALATIALVSSIAPLGGDPYIVGTLVYEESATQASGAYWETYGDVAWAISGRAKSMMKAPSPVHLLEYSPRGDEALTASGPSGWSRADAADWAQQTKADPRKCGGYSHIWRVKLDGERRPDYAHAVDLIARAGIGGDNGIPRWSPDGRRFLFLHYDGCWKLEGVAYGVKYPPELWIMNADGTGAREISAPGRGYSNNGTALWADSSHVLYAGRIRGPKDVSCGSTTCRLVLADVDSGRSRDLPLRYGAMSPDGRWIVGVWMDPPHGVIAVNKAPGWYKPSAGDYTWKLVLMRPDGTGERVLLRGAESLANLPADPCEVAVSVTPRSLAWSPDSRQFAFIGVLRWDRKGPPIDRQTELYIYDLRSGRLTQMTHDDRAQCTPVWME